MTFSASNQSKAVHDIQAVIAGAQVVLENHGIDTLGTDYLRKIAAGRIAELQAILGECVGHGLTATIDDVLQPLYTEFTRIAVELEEQYSGSTVLVDNLSDSELEAALIQRESAMAALDDARVAGMLLMTHLQRVVNYTKLSKP